MFAARHRPLVLLEDRLLALRLSLNAPIVATAEISPGPARAAIVVYAEAAHRRYAVVVRSLRTGSAAVYELEGDDFGDPSAWAVALDASLSFGESMGFLFDDEMLTDRRAETLKRGLARIREILAPPDIGDGEEPAKPTAPAAHRDDAAEILLEDELDHGSRAGDPFGRDTTGPLRTPVPEPAVPLSKFRATPPEPAPAASLDPGESQQGRSSKPLGRVKPVRKRAAGPDAPPPVDPLARLLADF